MWLSPLELGLTTLIPVKKLTLKDLYSWRERLVASGGFSRPGVRMDELKAEKLGVDPSAVYEDKAATRDQAELGALPALIALQVLKYLDDYPEVDF